MYTTHSWNELLWSVQNNNIIKVIALKSKLQTMLDDANECHCLKVKGTESFSDKNFNLVG